MSRDYITYQHKTRTVVSAVSLLCLVGMSGIAHAQDGSPRPVVQPAQSMEEKLAEFLSKTDQLRNEAEALEKQGQFKEAEERYRSLVKMYGVTSHWQANVAACLTKQGKQQDALEAYRTLIFSDAWELQTRSRPAEDEKLIMLDFIVLSTSSPYGRWTEAVDMYNRITAAKNLPNRTLPYPDVVFNREVPRPQKLQAMAHLYRSQLEREPSKRLGYCQEAVRLAPTEPFCRLYLGYYLYQRWSPDRKLWNTWNVEARDELNKALSLGIRKGTAHDAAQKLIEENSYKHLVPPGQSSQ